MLKIYSVYDSKAQGFIQPFYCVNSAVALRSFASAAGDEGHEFHRHAEDFCLYEIGEWFPDTGMINVYEKHVNLGLASQFLFGNLQEVGR